MSGQNTASFDGAAASYDKVFTDSPIGKLQRGRVQSYLSSRFGGKRRQILELNCGTGADAVWLAETGHTVHATDASAEMVNLTLEKAAASSASGRISAEVATFANAPALCRDGQYDLVFSNFGGLNCISGAQFSDFLWEMGEAMQPGCRLVMVLMPRVCLWETLYFSLKFNSGSARRRWDGGPVIAQLNPGAVKTWYFSPKQVTEWSRGAFSRVHLQPVGVLIPPGYLDPFFASRKGFLNNLAAWERKVDNWPWLAQMADHFLIDLVRN